MWSYPWGYAVGGRPALPGTWVGTLVTEGGLRSGLVLELGLRPLSSGGGRRSRLGSLTRGKNATTLIASARMCDARGEQVLTGTGSAADKQASKFSIALEQADSTHQPNGLAISGMDGGWDGANSLTVTALPFWRERRQAVIRRDDPNVNVTPPFPLKRGTENDYREICQRLGAKS